MYINVSHTEYHHLTVKWIDDYLVDKGYVRMKCFGKVMHRKASVNGGYQVYTYNLNVYVRGRLANYVLAEIQNNDNIFVIGRTIDKRLKGNYTIRAVAAECIYREDWLNFYRARGSVDPRDYEDCYFSDEEWSDIE